MFPATLDEYVPAGCEVRVVSSLIDQMDLRVLYEAYPGGGRPAYDPRIMFKILTFAYMKRQRSSRGIAQALENDVRFMWLSEGERPDHRTLARFRRSHEKAFHRLFKETVKQCSTLGLVSLEQVAVDGTKIEANASKESVHYAKTSAERLAKLNRQIDRILEEAEAADAREDAELGDRRGDEIPEELQTAEGRKAAIERAKREMEETGRSSYVETDPDSRLMRTSRGIRPSYNGQIGVDGKAQVVIAESVVQAEVDHSELPDVMDQVQENVGGMPAHLTADAGYHSKDTETYVEEHGLDAYIPPAPDPARLTQLRESMTYDEVADVYRHEDGRVFTFCQIQRKDRRLYRVYRCGRNMFSRRLDGELTELMRAKLRTKEGRAIFALRRQTVEPVFGRMKENLGLNRFRLRGLSGARIEFSLACIAHNLLKASKAVGLQAATA
jgi:transposase